MLPPLPPPPWAGVEPGGRGQQAKEEEEQEEEGRGDGVSKYKEENFMMEKPTKTMCYQCLTMYFRFLYKKRK